MSPQELRALLKSAFRWLGDRTDDLGQADVTGWWRDPDVMAALGPALADLFSEDRTTVILGPQSRGSLLGPLVATHLGLGFVEVRKDPERGPDSERFLKRATPPDYQDRHLTMGFRRDLVSTGDRVLLVDDWADTGAQLSACHALVTDAGATWVGAAVIVDALERPDLRRSLAVRALLHIRDL